MSDETTRPQFADGWVKGSSISDLALACETAAPLRNEQRQLHEDDLIGIAAVLRDYLRLLAAESARLTPAGSNCPTCGARPVSAILDVLREEAARPPRPPDAPAEQWERLITSLGRMRACGKPSCAHSSCYEVSAVIALVQELRAAQPASGETPPPWTRQEVEDMANYEEGLCGRETKISQMLRYLAQTLPDPATAPASDQE